jgi:DNA-binding NarL/FixJ family response regulator
VNGERVTGRTRLRNADVMRFGNTQVTFRSPDGMTVDETHIAGDAPEAAKLSETQKKVLVALCRPFKEGTAYATAATNQQIADEIFLSVDAVKAHLRVLFEKFGVADLPQNQKRAALVERAFHSGAVVPRDL